MLASVSECVCVCVCVCCETDESETTTVRAWQVTGGAGGASALSASRVCVRACVCVNACV